MGLFDKIRFGKRKKEEEIIPLDKDVDYERYYFNEGPGELGTPVSGYLGPGQPSEEQPIEGEFREVPNSQTSGPSTSQSQAQSTPPPGRSIGEDYSYEEGRPGMRPPTREEREAAEFKLKLEKEKAKAEYEAIGRKRQKEERELERERKRFKFEESKLGHERRERTRREVGAWAGGIQKMVTVPGGKKKLIEHRELYLPTSSAAEKLYIPKEGRKALRDATSIPYQSLRKSTQLGEEVNPSLAKMVMPRLASGSQSSPLKKGLDYEFLRRVGMPKGLSKVEQAAFNSVAATPGRDTIQSVVGALAREGYSKKQARTAVERLVLKGHVRQIQEGPGERKLLEVA